MTIHLHRAQALWYKLAFICLAADLDCLHQVKGSVKGGRQIREGYVMIGKTYIERKHGGLCQCFQKPLFLLVLTENLKSFQNALF